METLWNSPECDLRALLKKCMLWPLVLLPDLWHTYSQNIFIPCIFLPNFIKICLILLKSSNGNHIFRYIISYFRIFNELWPLTFYPHSPKWNFGYVLIPCTFISNYIKIHRTLLKLSNGNNCSQDSLPTDGSVTSSAMLTRG